MDYCHYRFSCTSCGSEIMLVSVEVNPIICECGGCGRVIIIEGGTLYTVSREFFSELSRTYQFKACGQVTRTIKHPVNSAENQGYPQKKPISPKDVAELRSFLEKSEDSLEMLKKYW